MKKSVYIRGIALQKFLNFTELFLFPIIHERKPDNIVLEKNIPYGDPKKHELCNFIYPQNTNSSQKKLPLMIMFHGGGWVSGYKSLRNYYAYHAASDGYFVANIDYCPAPQQIFPYQLRQLFKGIDFVLDKAEEYNIDTSKVVLVGESAGGYFVLEIAAIVKNKDLFDKLNIDFKHRDNFDVTANISNCGAIDIVRLLDTGFPFMRTMVQCYTDMTKTEILDGVGEEKVQIMSPTNYIDKNYPPTMIIYASKDALRKESLVLQAQLEALGVPHELYKGEGFLSLHAAGIATKLKRGKDCIRKSLDFVNKYAKE